MDKKKDYILQPHLYSGDSDSDKSELLFNNLIWLTTKEASVYLRKSVNALHTLVSRRHIRARKFRNRLYFNKKEFSYLIETSQFRGGF
jgi:hypothetical protein